MRVVPAKPRGRGRPRKPQEQLAPRKKYVKKVHPDAAEHPKAVGDGTFKHMWGECSPSLKKGRWTKDEDEKLKQSVTSYLSSKGLDVKDAIPVLMAKRSTESKEISDAWYEIAKVFADRSLLSVYNRTERLFSEGNNRGAWTDAEVGLMLHLVDQHGTKWAMIGKQINRIAGAVKEKYSKIALGDGAKDGRWTKFETDKLKDAVAENMGDDKAVNWAAVQRSVGSRTMSQCISKWYDLESGRATKRGRQGY